MAKLIPLLIYMAVMVAISFYVRKVQQGRGFLESYFVGSRQLGGFVLAMTTVATYSSVSSFVGGPGMAFEVGFGWLYMAVVQVTAVFLVLGIFGKRVAILARKFNAVTVVDILRARYKSELLAGFAALAIVLFFSGTMTAQFVGGAKLFSAVTGYSYESGLMLFGLVVVVYTSIGGFRAVALTDTCCAMMMMLGIVILLYYVLNAGGGVEAILGKLQVERPEMFEPFSGGKMPWTLYLTQWLLVGVCTIALPQSVVRGISYKDTVGMRQAMVIGTLVIGFMNIGINFVGILAHGVLSGGAAENGGVDNVIPQAIVTAVPENLVGLAIIGPLAASISTISGLLIVASSAVVKDVYVHYNNSRGREVAPESMRRLSMITTALMGVIVFVVALTPPSLIWLINMFAFGGLETAFFWTLVLGLYWKGANRLGAEMSMIGGTIVYCTTQAIGFKVFDLHQITLGMAASLIFFLIGARLGKKTDEATLREFF